MKRGSLSTLLLLALTASCVSSAHSAHGENAHWVGSWEAPPQLTEPRNLPPAPGLSASTLRQVMHLSAGGTHLRMRFSNEFGATPMRIASVRVARSLGADSIDAGTDTPLLFHGDTSITIAAGAAAMSDETAFASAPLSEITVSVYVTEMPADVTGHPGSRTTSYLLPGNHVASPSLAQAVKTEHWYLLSSIDVLSHDFSAAVVILGNSIADGRGSGTDKNNRWPDNLARRLQRNPGTTGVAVLNAGIGGNTILRGGLGPTALVRFDRDVLGQTGARWLIVSEGVNDIGGARGVDSSASVARQLIDAYTGIIARAHAKGMRVYGATILPFAGSGYGSAEHEAAQQTVNAWVRSGGAFDAVIDFDAAMRDPVEPSRLLPAADGGDHLHPNELGYRMMADAIDLSLFSRP
jgi:lysophospholipase L1-like esterase